MGTLSKGKTFTVNEEVTNTKLHQLVDSATISNIQTADIADSQVTKAKLGADCIDATKIEDDAVDSEHIVDGSVDNVHLAGSIADSKLSQITTASKVSGIALTALASVPAGAGELPNANLAEIANDKLAQIVTASKVSGIALTALTSIPSAAGAIPTANLTNALQVKVGAFSRDISTATGTQAVTGVGFQPKAVIVIANTNTTAKTSIGFTDGTSQGVIHDYQEESADGWGVSSSYTIFVVHGSGVYYSGSITTLGADGFTVSWTKTGSPTGTLSCNYLAIA